MTIEEELKRDIISFARNEGCTAEEIKSLLATLQESIDKRDIRDINLGTRAGRSDAVDYMLRLAESMNDENISAYDKALKFLGALLSLNHLYKKPPKKKNVTQKLLKTDWVPRCVREFQDVMPPINKAYPKVYYATGQTLEQRLQEASAKIHSRVEFAIDYSLYYSHGETGDAILIYMDNLEAEDYATFAQNFWSYLGSFYAINSWPEDWFWEYEFDHIHDTPESYGYDMWRVFTGVAISNIVHYKNSSVDVETEKTEVSEKEGIEKWRVWLLKNAFLNKNGDDNIDISSLASYFASLFTDILAFSDFTEKPKIDDCILTAPDYLQPILLEMKNLFAQQMKRIPFWVIDKHMLSDVGKLVMKMKRAIRDFIAASFNKKDKQKAKKKARKAQKNARKRNR